MYTPPYFAETDRTALHDLIERHSFGVLVSLVDGVPFATHLPFLLNRDAGPHGALVGHVARANPHWRELTAQPALAVFSGPHAYISPTWYESTHVVPTWNYVAVHVTGRATLVEERDALLDIVRRTVTYYESALSNPWVMDESGTFVDRLLPQIVGFRIEITKIEGKQKLNQNHPTERREKVIRALQSRGDENATDIASLMRATLDTGK
ncbi:transcriptional regulator : Transcriptional regulator OS=Singulisphaera acidiphila (strain ATCC BAA-1392 / DSM 18658 / VKM B-2454 / MOB10) GN=Sinac_7182 PE=4 SV=1: FMN_bind_2 [Gemmata massiliana]|uniref:Transcriptional regulator n=1 Tax=Gemmata massiliana TaxID=1210884 RepID=A0A6P2CUF3_9BACT|nr:FMN-binding negative transcriptional regulator [Gemmata massiliana]VTR92187.1 transcriptional regulator : Transcriptional regulator OS=Singulisphaera acidiphila (strain ATCC BAA-1392 / DSM 18658 / VKM B-2454 / MOB10) GN=Sinac_7182 PE=4 SV=1: FMN_bind_2 [Gemmata massiliana]